MDPNTRVLPITRNSLITRLKLLRGLWVNTDDNALAEAVNGLYKTELIYSQPRSSLTEVESATMNWVHRWNYERLHEALRDKSPTEIIDKYNQAQVSELPPYKKRNKTQDASHLGRWRNWSCCLARLRRRILLHLSNCGREC
ncbi:integrase core domain-containing protein [Trueperella pyogenes]|uniref:integrase core domain-containing protein n=1 Tax=Trueperella pyogenes TaxID=1661 RepID=UPI0038734740